MKCTVHLLWIAQMQWSGAYLPMQMGVLNITVSAHMIYRRQVDEVCHHAVIARKHHARLDARREYWLHGESLQGLVDQSPTRQYNGAHSYK